MNLVPAITSFFHASLCTYETQRMQTLLTAVSLPACASLCLHVRNMYMIGCVYPLSIHVSAHACVCVCVCACPIAIFSYSYLEDLFSVPCFASIKVSDCSSCSGGRSCFAGRRVAVTVAARFRCSVRDRFPSLRKAVPVTPRTR